MMEILATVLGVCFVALVMLSLCRELAKPCSRPFKGRSGKSRGSFGKIGESWSSCSLR